MTDSIYWLNFQITLANKTIKILNVRKGHLDHDYYTVHILIRVF